MPPLVFWIVAPLTTGIVLSMFTLSLCRVWLRGRSLAVSENGTEPSASVPSDVNGPARYAYTVPPTVQLAGVAHGVVLRASEEALTSAGLTDEMSALTLVIGLTSVVLAKT